MGRPGLGWRWPVHQLAKLYGRVQSGCQTGIINTEDVNYQVQRQKNFLERNVITEHCTRRACITA